MPGHNDTDYEDELRAPEKPENWGERYDKPHRVERAGNDEWMQEFVFPRTREGTIDIQSRHQLFVPRQSGDRPRDAARRLRAKLKMRLEGGDGA